jgi:bifunctional non-homologous end joining protein LigD
MQRFVVMKHEAKRARLHYDLRFVMPNSKVWASFAVRKEIPLVPGPKVLAIKTHDHTEEEALFTGTIEQGYGAGKLSVWDSGECNVIKFAPGHIQVDFKGHKVKGIYHLINTGVANRRYNENTFMLFKGKTQMAEQINDYLESLQGD